jgi:hypothetical protein
MPSRLAASTAHPGELGFQLRDVVESVVTLATVLVAEAVAEIGELGFEAVREMLVVEAEGVSPCHQTGSPRTR